MPAPVNIDFANAIDLGSLPADVTQQVDDAGTTYEVFYKFTAPVGANVVGAWGFGDLSVYIPTTRPYDSSEVQILALAPVNKPMQFPVTAGQLYYLKFTPNGGNPTPANLRVRVEVANHDDWQAGDPMVIADRDGDPSIIFDIATDYATRRFVKDFPFDSAASATDNLSDGTILTVDEANLVLKLFDDDFNLLATPITGITASSTCIRANRTVNAFYVVTASSPPIVQRVSNLGVVGGTTYSITGSITLRSLCVNNDETKLLYARTTFGADLRRWDLTGNTDDGVILAGTANYLIQDILALTDGTFLISSCRLGGFPPVDTNVYRIDIDGNILDTYAFGTDFYDAVPRLAYSNDHPDYFWIWGHVDLSLGGPFHQFRKVRISDGVTTVTKTYAEYENGIYKPTATATPLARFGAANCCDFIVMVGEPTPEEDHLYKMTDRRNDGTAIPTPFFITALLGD